VCFKFSYVQHSDDRKLSVEENPDIYIYNVSLYLRFGNLLWWKSKIIIFNNKIVDNFYFQVDYLCCRVPKGAIAGHYLLGNITYSKDEGVRKVVSSIKHCVDAHNSLLFSKPHHTSMELLINHQVAN